MTSVLRRERDGAGTPRRRGRGVAVTPGASTCGDGDGERDIRTLGQSSAGVCGWAMVVESASVGKGARAGVSSTAQHTDRKTDLLPSDKIRRWTKRLGTTSILSTVLARDKIDYRHVFCMNGLVGDGTGGPTGLSRCFSST